MTIEGVTVSVCSLSPPSFFSLHLPNLALTCLGAIGLADRNIASGLIIGCFPSFPTCDLGLIWVRLYSVLIDFASLVLP